MNNSSKKNEATSLQVFVFQYLKYWKWILLSILLSCTVAVAYVYTTDVIYNISANVIVKDEEKSNSLMGSLSKNMGLSDLGGGSSNVEDEAVIMKSYSKLKKMAYDLDLYKVYEHKKFPFNKSLYKNSPIVLNVEKSIIDTLSIGLLFNVEVSDDKISVEMEAKGQKNITAHFNSFPILFKTPNGDFTFEKTEFTLKNKNYTLNISLVPLNVVAEGLGREISVSLIKRKSEILALGVRENIPQRGIDKLNYLINSYNINALEEKNEVARNTNLFIEERLLAISFDVDSLERKIAFFKKSNKLVDLSSAADVFFRRYQSSIDRKLESEVQTNIINMLEEYIKKPGSQYQLIPIAAQMPEGVVKVVSEYNAAILERQRLLKASNENNPMVVVLDSRIASLSEAVKLSIGNIKKDLNVYRKQWDILDREMNAEMANMPQKELEYTDIERQRQIKTSLYIFLLNKREETQLLLASTSTKAQIINSAYRQTIPVAPRKKIILLLSAIIGLCIPIVIIYTRKLLKTKISSKDELMEATNIPVIGEICFNKTDSKIVVNNGEATSIAELFRLVRTNMQFVLKKGEKVILITSSISGEGKTFFTLNLGRSLSLIGNKKVIIIGLDIRSPRLAEYIGVKNNLGITSYLASEDVNPEDIIVQVPGLTPNFYMIPAGPIPPNPSELLLSDRLDTLFEYLRGNFDFILVDTAPTALVSDTFSLDRISDASLFLFRADYTNKSYLRLIESYIEDDKLKKVSLVVNGTTTKASYGYGYGKNN